MKRKALGRGLSALLPDVPLTQDEQLDEVQDAAQDISHSVPEENVDEPNLHSGKS